MSSVSVVLSVVVMVMLLDVKVAESHLIRNNKGIKGRSVAFILTKLTTPADLTWTNQITDFPDELDYDLEVEGHGKFHLQLHKNRFVNLPERIVQLRTGKFNVVNSNIRSIAIYSDKNGKGSFACRLSYDGTKVCEMSGLFHVGQDSCYFGFDSVEADCTRAANGNLEYFNVPNTTPGNLSASALLTKLMKRQNHNSFNLQEGRKVLELAIIADKAFMSTFYDRHPHDVARAEEEASVFVAIFTNELNMFYSTVKEVSRGTLEILVHTVAFVYPDYDIDFAWSANHHDGSHLYRYLTFDQDLRDFINSQFTHQLWDHALALTGLDLYSDSTRLLGYSYKSTVCSDNQYKYSVNEYTAWNVAWIAAHQLGHALSAGHDETVECPAGKNVMSSYLFNPTLSTVNSYRHFSICSVRNFQHHLNSNPDCETNSGFSESQFRAAYCSGLLGDEATSLDVQCQKATGWVASQACSVINGDAGCHSNNHVACRTPDGTCSIFLRFVWNGTPCDTNKFCFKGKCVDSSALRCPLPNGSNDIWARRV